MSQFLNDFKLIIRQALYENTYKMAWAKALVELSNYKDLSEDKVTITLEEIGELMIKYYWDQTIFFNLIQGSNPSTPPYVLQYTKYLIHEYQTLSGNKAPIIFIKAKEFIDKNMKKLYEKMVRKTVNALKANVSYRFLVLDKKVYTNLYEYNKGDNEFIINSCDLQELKDNQDDLYDLINYRWSLILENFNSSPRINKKVRIMDNGDVKRSNLTRFDEFLDLENHEHICFICGKHIDDGDLSRDHVIPWSYLYSDDLWNLVYVHKSCNSSKSNIIPSKEEIEKLKERNLNLQKEMHKLMPNKKESKELDLAIEKDYVDQFYIGCKQ